MLWEGRGCLEIMAVQPSLSGVLTCWCLSSLRPVRLAFMKHPHCLQQTPPDFSPLPLLQSERQCSSLTAWSLHVLWWNTDAPTWLYFSQACVYAYNFLPAVSRPKILGQFGVLFSLVALDHTHKHTMPAFMFTHIYTGSVLDYIKFGLKVVLQ